MSVVRKEEVTEADFCPKCIEKKVTEVVGFEPTPSDITAWRLYHCAKDNFHCACSLDLLNANVWGVP